MAPEQQPIGGANSTFGAIGCGSRTGLTLVPIKCSKGERGNRVLRNLDKLVGVPILLLLGLLSQVRVRRRRPEKATRIGLLMLGVIGDSLLASAIVDDLKQRYPGAVVIGFMTDANRATSEILSGIDEYIFLSITDPLEAMRTVRKHPLDILIDFNQWARIGALLSFVSRSKFTVGFKTSGQYRHFLYDACATHRGDQHELENFRDLARCLAINPAGTPKLRAELKDIPVPQLPQFRISSFILGPQATDMSCANGVLRNGRSWEGRSSAKAIMSSFPAARLIANNH